jgi:hypothetical protein
MPYQINCKNDTSHITLKMPNKPVTIMNMIVALVSLGIFFNQHPFLTMGRVVGINQHQSLNNMVHTIFPFMDSRAHGCWKSSTKRLPIKDEMVAFHAPPSLLILALVIDLGSRAGAC